MQHKKRRYQSSRLIEKKRRKKIIFIFISVALFILFIVGLSYLSNHKAFYIEDIEVNELRFIDPVEVENLTREELKGKFMWLFSKSNSITFSRSKIEKSIREKYVSVKRADIDFRGFHKIRINIIENEPVAKWCDVKVNTILEPDHQNSSGSDSVIPNTNSNRDSEVCYFLNENGLVFVREPDVHAGRYITFFGFINDEKTPLGQTFANKNKFKELIDLTKFIRRLDISTEEIWTKTGEVYTLVTDSGAKLHIDNEDDITTIFSNLETVIEQDAINKAQFKNIDYIDLRFGNRVFYRLK